MEALGIDIGNVILSADTDVIEKTNPMVSNEYLATPPNEDCFEVIANLKTRFAERIYLVSKVGSIMQMKTRKWLDYHKFFEITGVDPYHIAFCLERKDKTRIAKQLNLTHFIDDGVEVLSYLNTVPYKFAFRPKKSELIRYQKIQHPIINQITIVYSWKEIENILLP